MSAKLFFLTLASCWCVTAQGFTYNMPMPGPDLLITSMITQRALQDRLISESGGSTAGSRQPGPAPGGANERRSADPVARSSAATTTQPVTAAGKANTAAKLAAGYPPASRAEAERLFNDLLVKYGQLARQLGQPPDDLGAAVAALLAASYMVYRDVQFPDSQFSALADQMRQVMRSSPEITALPAAQKREMYEESATLAMFLAGTRMALGKALSRQEADDIARNMKRAAEAYLEKLIGVSADRIRISTAGLSVDPAAP